MLLDSENVTVKIISVFKVDKDNTAGQYSQQTFNSISYRIYGKGTVISDNETIHVKTGDILFVPKGSDFSLDAEKEHLIIVRFTSDDPLPNQMKKYSVRDINYFNHKFNELHSRWISNIYGRYYECQSIINKILYKADIESICSKMITVKDTLPGALEYIQENFTSSDMTIDILADLCGISNTYFRKIFEKEFGISPLKYINNLRLHYALELLKSGYYSVASVSLMAGFNDPNYFSSFIKKMTGYSPSYFFKNRDSK